ncbi:hypothetical protein BDC45DRAFT_558556 [Circinella umbellata]|nr:hypothetical protein BDC45DRAFT_558556 [Circinella umbellata]
MNHEKPKRFLVVNAYNFKTSIVAYALRKKVRNLFTVNYYCVIAITGLRDKRYSLSVPLILKHLLENVSLKLKQKASQTYNCFTTCSSFTSIMDIQISTEFSDHFYFPIMNVLHDRSNVVQSYCTNSYVRSKTLLHNFFPFLLIRADIFKCLESIGFVTKFPL